MEPLISAFEELVNTTGLSGELLERQQTNQEKESQA